VHTLGNQCAYINEILKPDHLQLVNLNASTYIRIYEKMIWLKYFADVNNLRSNVCTASCDLTVKNRLEDDRSIVETCSLCNYLV